MAMHSTGLGKGLDALIRDSARDSLRDGGDGVRALPLKDIVPNPKQPRRDFNPEALEELAESIRAQGLLQPLLVRPLGAAAPGKYEIVAGERRWRACGLAGLSEVPVLVRAFSESDVLAAALIENLQREDLNPVEAAEGLQALKDELGLSQDELAKAVGKSRSAVANSLRLLGLPESMRPLLASGRLSAGHARALLSIADDRAREYLKNLILENELSVREAEGLAAGWKEHGRFSLGGSMDASSQAFADAGEDMGEVVRPPSRQPDGEIGAAESPPPSAPEPSAADSGGGAGGEQTAPRPQSAVVLDIQNRLAALLPVAVRVTGREDRGKISFAYSSKEELEMILQRLGASALRADDGESR